MIHVETYGSVKALHQGRHFLGILPPLMTVRCYAVDGLLIDTGLTTFHREVTSFAEDSRVHKAALTHHHEDHTGNAARLREQGVPVFGSDGTRQMLAKGFRLHLYQHLNWGKPHWTEIDILGDEIVTENYRFQVISAPGHSDDHVVFFEPNKGWLFSGDVFIAEKIKIFRRDEDFAKTIETLTRLSALPVKSIFCAHRPLLSGGQQALQRKLQYLQDIEGQVKQLASKGYSIKSITNETMGPEELLAWGLTWGDACKANIIRSILHGPTRRKDALVAEQ